MQFRDRREAGKALAKELSFLKGQDDVIILAIPRGGVVVGYEVAQTLSLPLDIYITRKIGAPYNPELALGAVASDGSFVLDQDLVTELSVPPAYIEQERARQRKEIQRRLEKYRGTTDELELEGKTVVLVDDGVATGSTVLAAIQALRQKSLKELILAIPVGPPKAVETLRQKVDRVVCLSTPERFWAVGAFYLVFDQTSDKTVMNLLEKAQ
jgi:predicted phosphoribosyltransferase